MTASRRRALAVAAPVLLAAALAVGCGDDAGGVDRASFERAMIDRYGATGHQAACITDYVFADYDDDQIRVIRDEGVTGLPLGEWDAYILSSAACLTSGQLPPP